MESAETTTDKQMLQTPDCRFAAFPSVRTPQDRVLGTDGRCLVARTPPSCQW